MTTFNADLRIAPTEEFGPKLNSRTVAILHPDMYQTNQDTGRARVAQREVDRDAYLPDNHLTNVVMKDANTLDSNGNLVARPATVPQLVGPGEPLAAVAGNPNDKAGLTETKDLGRIAYLDKAYAHTTSGTTGVGQEEGKVLYQS